ncbi:DUF4269 domain-containing protein [Gramella lutea]|uniref:DUF4269 domain-containing protein n=1 Tax=Christiangramia lutea TaxID=1607951 RepID=A0A9X1V4S6_9FLAO|nr:DUF4269 domain-containing protein [Christiangramia lutea]MCH4824407.1 DUF4269 domain-containing protein [Christiangramia lutea]
MSKDFKIIDYLKHGTTRQKEVFGIFKNHSIMEKLEEYSPILVGTIPINIDIDNSDLDIICFAKNLNSFLEFLNNKFSNEDEFIVIQKNIKGRQCVLARFRLDNYDCEIFGQNVPTHEQDAYLHMIKEYEILEKEGPEFRKTIIELKRTGLKTEPAFAQLLGIKGNPYSGLLKYQAHIN